LELRILLIDDEPDSIEPLLAEIGAALPGAQLKAVAFENAEAEFGTFDPHVIVLDLIAGTGAEGEEVGTGIRDRIWRRRFCPLVCYTARSEAADPGGLWNHPFVKVVKKGSGSEQEALACIKSYEPHITALHSVDKEIKWAMNCVLQEVAPIIFAGTSPTEVQEVLVRSARRRIAAKMDETLSGGGTLKSWEFYLVPASGQCPLTGDILRRRGGKWEDPAAHRVILSPSCDMVTGGTRKAKIGSALVACCKDVGRLVSDIGLAGIAKWGEEHRSKLIATLHQGHTQSCVPLPAYPGVLPAMVADLRALDLLPLDQVGEGPCEFARVASVDSPLRELFAWAYMLCAARPGLPERDFDSWANEVIGCLAAAKG
jgi:CTP synthase